MSGGGALAGCPWGGAGGPGSTAIDDAVGWRIDSSFAVLILGDVP